jgi:hypothetical protein
MTLLYMFHTPSFNVSVVIPKKSWGRHADVACLQKLLEQNRTFFQNIISEGLRGSYGRKKTTVTRKVVRNYMRILSE